MPAGPMLTPPTQALPDTLAPKKTLRLSNTRSKQTSAPTRELELLFASHTTTPSIRLQSTIDHDYDTISAVPQSDDPEDEYTLSAYGDISLSEVIVPPLSAPTHSLESGHPQPRLRLKVRRPPMPKRRLSYTYIPDPLPYTGGLDPDERWPGSPRPAKSKPWFQHQPLVSPLPANPATPRTQGNKQTKNGGSSLEKLFDVLAPPSPSIRLSPPGSPANQALGLLQEAQPSPTPASRQDKPKEAPWRTRLPPRLPIPKWDL